MTSAAVPAQQHARAAIRLRMTGIDKRFGRTRALEGVDFDVRAGEVHALLGENGAGKSTLMNIMSGVLAADAGSIEVDGVEASFASPAAAQRAGVVTVFQELDLVGGLTVADNLVLGQEPLGPLGTVSARRARGIASAALDRVGSTASVDDTVASLRLGEQQAVMIAKAMAQDARILILDEPTAALTAPEVRRLFTLVREVAARGVAVVFVSHRLEEIAQIADRVTVLREGRLVDTRSASATQHELVLLLTGRRPDELFPPRSTGVGAPMLELERLRVIPRFPRAGWRAPDRVDLVVRAGEIVGLVGLLGAGRTELLETLAGVAPAGRVDGVVRVGGTPVRLRSVQDALRAGIGFVPDDRRAAGFVPQRDVAENVLMASMDRFTRFGFLRGRAMARAARTAIARYGVKADGPEAGILSLSGGNQQKVVLGRALESSPKVVLLDEPTRGVDIGAKADIYTLIRRTAEQGGAVLIASSELPELCGLCDRLLIVRGGRVVGEATPETTPAELTDLAQPRPEELTV